MTVWLTMLKKDIWMLKSQWLGFMAVSVVVTAAVLIAHALGILDAARSAVIVGMALTGSLFVVFPAQLYRGINREVKGSAALWLQTPVSGWAMLGSKLVSSLIGSVTYFVVAYFLALALFHSVNLMHALPSVHHQIQGHAPRSGIPGQRSLVKDAPAYVDAVAGQMPRIEFYVMAGLLGVGLYLALWISLIYMAVRSVKNQFKRFGWLVGLGVVLVATWGLGGLKSTALYARTFGWGKVAVVDLFPSHVRVLVGRHLLGAIVAGHLAFDAIIGVLLFYLTGLIIDRYMEV